MRGTFFYAFHFVDCDHEFLGVFGSREEAERTAETSGKTGHHVVEAEREVDAWCQAFEAEIRKRNANKALHEAVDAIVSLDYVS